MFGPVGSGFRRHFGKGIAKPYSQDIGSLATEPFDVPHVAEQGSWRGLTEVRHYINIMKNQSRSEIYQAVIKEVAGITAHPELNITHTPAPALQLALDGARNAESFYQAARTGKASAYAALDAAKAVAREFCTKARDVLRPFLGTNWSTLWVEAGFKNASLAIPESSAELAELMRSLRQYFINHSSHQNPVALITDALAAAHLVTLNTGVSGVSACRRDQRTKRGARDTAEVALVKKMRKLEFELKAVMELDDPRWLDFLDEIPGETSVPEAVENVEAEGDGPGRLFIDWAPSIRAERYHLEILVVGTDAEFRRLVTVQDTSAQLSDLPVGATVKLRVRAVNAAGESAPSDVVTITVPAMEDAA